MSESEFAVFVGIDWATEKHQVCVLNAEGQVLSAPGEAWERGKRCEVRG